MKTSLKISAVATLAAVLVGSANAAGPSRGGPSGGRDYGSRSGPTTSSSRSYSGGYSRYSGDYRGGDRHHHYGGYRNYSGWSWGLSFSWPLYGAYGYPYYYSPYYGYDYYYPPTYYSPPVRYYSAPPPVVYSAPEPPETSNPTLGAPDSTRPPETDRPLPPSAVYKGVDGFPENPPERMEPRPLPPPQRPAAVQPMGLADVKAMVKAGIADEVLMSQIQQSRVVYRLSTQEIIDLKESGVSNKVIDYMINTASRQGR